MTQHSRLVARRLRASVGALLLGTTVAVTAPTVAPAVAAAPVPPVAELTMDACAGTTDATPDRTLTPDELAAYNAGHIVPIYDAYGYRGPDDEAFPPLCAVRYLSEAEGGPVGGGPVSAWLFCTHAYRSACLNGKALDVDADQNLSLSDFERNIVAYLVQYGTVFQALPYVNDDGEDDFFPMTGAAGTPARSDLDFDSRARLQYLIWCVTDFQEDDGNFGAFCELNNLGADDLEERFGFLNTPQTTQVLQVVGGPTFAGVVGEVLTVPVRTNIVNAPLSVSVNNATVAVCSGQSDVTYSGGILTVVHATDTPPDEPRTVNLCVTPTAATTLTLRAEGLPTTTQSLHWYHNGDDGCQVFAAFNFLTSDALTATVSIFAEDAPTGAVSVVKRVVTIGDVEFAADAEYIVSYVCDAVSGTMTLTADVPVSIADLPVGTECTLTETSFTLPVSGEYSSARWSNNAEDGPSTSVTIIETVPDAPIALTLTNTFREEDLELTSMTVSKAFDLFAEAEAEARRHSYLIDYRCTHPRLEERTGTIVLRIGEQVPIPDLGVGSNCTVTEANLPDVADGYVWLEPLFTAVGATDVVLQARGIQFTLPTTTNPVVAVTVTNRLAATEVLASTGSDNSMALAFGGGLTLGGLGLLGLAMWRRRVS